MTTGASTMEVIAVTSGKGGTGKTIVSASLGYALTRAGHRVLMIDADTATDGLSLFLLGPQGVEQHQAFRPENTFAAVLQPADGVEEWRVLPRQLNRSASQDHGVIYQALISGTGLYGDTPPPAPVDREQFRRGVANLFRQLEERGEYDYIIVDTRGGFSFDTTDVCALAHSFILVVEPDYTSFYQARNLVREVSTAALELERRPLLRAIFVNKALEVTQEAGALALDKMEVSFRLELAKEFDQAGIRFENTHPIPLDPEVLKAYKTQRMPLRHDPAYKFSFAVLSAFADILQVITSPWTRAQAEEWNRLVDSVSAVIAQQNAIVRHAADDEQRRSEELASLRTELRHLQDELDRSRRDLTDTKERYERELSRTQIILERLPSTPSPQPSGVHPLLLPFLAGLALALVAVVIAWGVIFRNFEPRGTPTPAPASAAATAASGPSQDPAEATSSTPTGIPQPTVPATRSPAAVVASTDSSQQLKPSGAASPAAQAIATSPDPRSQVPATAPANTFFVADWGRFPEQWSATPDWQVVGGILTNDGSRAKSSARATWRPAPNQDYAVEAEIRGIGCSKTDAGTGFGVMYAETPEAPSTPWFVNLCSEDATSPVRRGEWLVQRTEIRGDLINQCQNGVLLPISTRGVSSDQTPHSRRSQFQAVGLFSDQERVEVRSFRVVPPTPGELCAAPR